MADNQDSNAENKDLATSALQKEASLIQSEFQQTWGWLNLFRQLAIFVNTSLFDILENRTALEVFTLCTFMIDDSERATIKYQTREN